MSSRMERAVAVEQWADRVEPEMLKEADQETLRAIAALVDLRNQTDEDLAAAVASARELGCTWSEIGAVLGVSKQAVQRKYGATAPATRRGGLSL